VADKASPADVGQRLQQLRDWEAAAQREVDQFSAELAAVQQRLTAAREQVELLGRLIRLTEQEPRGSVSIATPATSDWSVRADLEGYVEQVLEAAGGPMHIRDIRRALIERSVPLPGRGDEANIIVRLSRASKTFTRTARGTYALASWGIPAMPPRRSRRRAAGR
jgi:hypothetical protein